MTNKLHEQAKALREAANVLESQAEELELVDIREKYKDIIGSCWEVINSNGEDRWIEYYHVQSIEQYYVNFESEPNLYLSCSRFSLTRPDTGLYYVGDDKCYLSTLQGSGRQIRRETFDKKFLEFKKAMDVLDANKE